MENVFLSNMGRNINNGIKNSKVDFRKYSITIINWLKGELRGALTSTIVEFQNK